jgi:hypothetical protein
MNYNFHKINKTMPSFGSGSKQLGMTSAITAALQRRRMGDSVSPLSQVSGASPSSQQGAPPIAPTTSAQPMNAPPQVSPNAQKVGQTEAQVILKAMSNRLENLSKMGQ